VGKVYTQVDLTLPMIVDEHYLTKMM